MNIGALVNGLAGLAGQVGGMLGGNAIGEVVQIGETVIKLIGDVRGTLGEQDAAKLDAALVGLEQRIAAHKDRVFAKLDAAAQR